MDWVHKILSFDLNPIRKVQSQNVSGNYLKGVDEWCEIDFWLRMFVPYNKCSSPLASLIGSQFEAIANGADIARVWV